MTYIYWQTPAGNLGTYTEGTYFELPLEVFNPSNVATTFSFISGQLPDGIQVNQASGKLQGVPIVNNVLGVAQTQLYKFTIRATVGSNVVDRSFSMGVTNIEPPIIQPTTTFLGSVFDGWQTDCETV